MDWNKKTKKRRRKSDIYVPIILLAPAFLLVVGVILYPICYAVGLSFQYYKLTDYANRHFVGLENYISVWSNETFLASLGNTVKWVGITVICQFLFGLVLALILRRDPFDYADALGHPRGGYCPHVGLDLQWEFWDFK